LLRTADATSANVPAGSVLASLIVYVIVYLTVFGFAAWYLLQMLRVGPVRAPQRQRVRTAARPLSLGDEEM
jgi:cytochrome d ubiquinol oxidase subunit I